MSTTTEARKSFNKAKGFGFIEQNRSSMSHFSEHPGNRFETLAERPEGETA